MPSHEEEDLLDAGDQAELPEVWLDSLEDEDVSKQDRKPKYDKRRMIERYWEQKRLRSQIEDFDFDGDDN